MHHRYTDEELIRRLKRPPGVASFGALRRLENVIETRRRELILEARRRGWDWYDIGAALRVSPQAVHQRWKRYINEGQDLDEG